MSLSKRIAQAKTLLSLGSILTIATVLTTSTALRQLLRSLFSPTAHPFRFGAVILALFLNAKALPLVWHGRFAKAMLFQTYLRTTPLPRDALFRPMVTQGMYTPTPETDFNGHKSNSTYFADLDIARTQHVSCLLAHGIRNAAARTHPDLSLKGDDAAVKVEVDADGSGKGKGKAAKPGRAVFAIALGAVSCHFKREIKPYERFDIWTRLLAWDSKWIYQVTHMVRPGAVPPDHAALQPWRSTASTTPAELDRGAARDAVFATSISKYVVKRGRQTVPPELVFRSSHLLPPRPGEPPNENSAKPASGRGAPDAWCWEGVEAERLRGMALAEHFAALDGADGLHDEFPVSGLESRNGVEVLGEYRDLYL